MAKNDRIFISFAIEDVKLRDFLVGQARNEKSPFSFVDMSVKKGPFRHGLRGSKGRITSLM